MKKTFITVLSFSFFAVSAFSAESILDYPALESIARRTDSIESFVNELPSHMKSGEGFTVGYATHGLLKSTHENPNFYLFGNKNSSVVVVFQNHALSEAGTEDVEVLSYDREKKEHSLHVFTFAKGRSTQFQRNPQACKQCHGETQRPLWRSGYTWEGFYGANNDGLSAEEKPHFAKLIHASTGNSTLLDLKNLYGYADKKALRPNIDMTLRLGSEQAEKIAHRILNHPDYKKNRLYIAKAMALCSDYKQIDSLLGVFGIQPEDWYLNKDLKLDWANNNPAYFSYDSMYETGVGPIEFAVLSHLLNADSELSAVFGDKLHITKKDAQYDFQQTTSSFPNPYWANPNFADGSAGPYSYVDPTPKWCNSIAHAPTENGLKQFNQLVLVKEQSWKYSDTEAPKQLREFCDLEAQKLSAKLQSVLGNTDVVVHDYKVNSVVKLMKSSRASCFAEVSINSNRTIGFITVKERINNLGLRGFREDESRKGNLDSACDSIADDLSQNTSEVYQRRFTEKGVYTGTSCHVHSMRLSVGQ